MPLDEAFHHPRIDASGGESVGVDPRLAQPIKDVLQEKFPLNKTELVVYPTNFACPSAVMQNAEGEHFGMSDVMSPNSASVGQ